VGIFAESIGEQGAVCADSEPLLSDEKRAIFG
jgi:hypothetical protein